MNRINLDRFSNQEMEQERNQKIQALLNDSCVLGLLKKYEIPEEQVKLNPYMFSSWLKEFAICKGCKQLTCCKQKKKGYRAGLRYDGIMHEVIEACPYQEKRKERSTYGSICHCGFI